MPIPDANQGVVIVPTSPISDAVPATARTGSRPGRPTCPPPPLPGELGTSGEIRLGLGGLLAVAPVAFALRGQPLLAARFETTP